MATGCARWWRTRRATSSSSPRACRTRCSTPATASPWWPWSPAPTRASGRTSSPTTGPAPASCRRSREKTAREKQRMLRYERVVPDAVREDAPLVVLMHGRGADRFDLAGLAPLIAPDAVVVTPEAPWPGAPWGYGPGWAWYRFLGRNLPEPESFAAAQEALAEF